MNRNLYFISLSVIIALLLITACGSQTTPTALPVAEPIEAPAVEPTAGPTVEPTAAPTTEPTKAPAVEPTDLPPVEFVKIINSDANPLSKPLAVAIDDQDNLYVLEAGANRVTEFDADGQFVTAWGSKGSGDGQFNLNNPTPPEGYPLVDAYGDIEVDSSGNVYVVDTFNYRVQKFARDGTFLTKWGEAEAVGTAPDGKFGLPSGIAIDGDDNIYIGDGLRPDIQKFDPEGNFLGKIGEDRLGSNVPYGWGVSVAITDQGLILVADIGSESIQVFDPQGQFIREWPASGMWSIEPDKDGNLFAALAIDDYLAKYDLEGNRLLRWGERGGGDGQLRRPMSVALDSQGLIYVADFSNNRIQVYRLR